jgi:hypothetical protein
MRQTGHIRFYHATVRKVTANTIKYSVSTGIQNRPNEALTGAKDEGYKGQDQTQCKNPDRGETVAKLQKVGGFTTGQGIGLSLPGHESTRPLSLLCLLTFAVLLRRLRSSAPP